MDGRIDGVEGEWRIDTGSGGGAIMFPAFAAAHGFADRQPSIEIRSAGGFGRTLTQSLVRLNQLKIGPYVIEAPYVGISHQRTGAFASSAGAGNLGMSFLRRFVSTFDYRCRSLTLEPAAFIDAPELVTGPDSPSRSPPTDRSGYCMSFHPPCR